MLVLSELFMLHRLHTWFTQQATGCAADTTEVQLLLLQIWLIVRYNTARSFIGRNGICVSA